MILPLLTLAHPVVQPPLSLPRSPFRPSAFRPLIRFFVSFSFHRSPSPSSVSPLLFLRLPPRHSALIFNYWLRERSRIARKKRETKSLTVSACTSARCVCTALPPSNGVSKRREIKVYIRGASGRKKQRTGGKGVSRERRVRRRAFWQKSQTSERRSVHGSWLSVQNAIVHRARGMSTAPDVTRNASRSPIETYLN